MGGRRRLRWSPQIQEIIRRGKRVGNTYFTISYRIGSGEERRLGLVFGKRAGRPVVRNRAKRILRASFRLSYDRLKAGLEMVVMARMDLSALTSKEIRRLFEALLKQARLLNAYEPSMLRP